MGVKGLQFFIERQCPEACTSVSIEELAETHRRLHNCQPVLVVDGMALIYPLYSTSLEWVYGGQWLQFYRILENFIKRFHSAGVKLVFFFDGTVCSAKRDEWVKRRVSKYKKILSVFRSVQDFGCEPGKKLFQLPTSMGTLTRFALKELGAEVYQTDREADEVIAEYASRNNNVFGILSQDSDFIIYNTKPYLSLSHLDLNTLQTLHYDRNCFARYMRLYLNQLPLFACLSGNDIIPSEKLKHFHQSLSKRNDRTFLSDIAHALVRLIHSERWTGDLTNKLELDNISIKVFGNTNYSVLLHDGLKSYAIGYPNSPPTVCIHLHPEFEKALYERHVDCLNGPFIFNLLCNMEYESSEVLEDQFSLPSALIYREVRQRCYGVLFNCFRTFNDHGNKNSTKNGRNIAISEWCAYHGNLMERPESIQPLPLRCSNVVESEKNKIPSIEELWFRYTDVERLRIFWSIFQAPIAFELLFRLPKHLIVPCCILNYLIGRDAILKPWEVAVFIIQLLWKKDVADLEKMQVPWVDTTAVHLTTVFMRGVTTAIMVLGTCGYPLELSYAMPWNFFDGKLFHFLYVKTKERPSIAEMCMNQVGLMEDFYKFLPVFTNNTVYAVDQLNWKSVFGDF